jgi:hypothetical protein
MGRARVGVCHATAKEVPLATHQAMVPRCFCCVSDADRPVPDTNPHLHDRQLLKGQSGGQRPVALSGVIERSAGHDC